MAVLLRYLTSVRLLYSIVHWTSYILQGTRNTRPCLSGHPADGHSWWEGIILYQNIPCYFYLYEESLTERAEKAGQWTWNFQKYIASCFRGICRTLLFTLRKYQIPDFSVLLLRIFTLLLSRFSLNYLQKSFFRRILLNLRFMTQRIFTKVTFELTSLFSFRLLKNLRKKVKASPRLGTKRPNLRPRTRRRTNFRTLTIRDNSSAFSEPASRGIYSS